jgi:uncharacterized protein YxeA
METQNFTDFTEKFICNLCNIKCSRTSEWDRHINTRKHQKQLLGNTKDINFTDKKNYKCSCGKIYATNCGLWKHKKNCLNNNEIENIKIENTMVDSSSNEIKILTNLVIELVKSNNELQKQMIDVCQKIQPGNNTTINTNSHNTTNNKTFNLQVFLNEECKDAMNMSDFINSIELKISDLVNIGKLGYVEGVSNIIIKQLNDTDINKRPVHCSDAKRETLYVKEENKWEKETQETKQMLTAVRGVNKKNYTLLHNWKETHPKCMDSKSNQSDEYMKITSKVMDGDVENINKVIKKIAKQVLIEK